MDVADYDWSDIGPIDEWWLVFSCRDHPWRWHGIDIALSVNAEALFRLPISRSIVLLSANSLSRHCFLSNSLLVLLIIGFNLVGCFSLDVPAKPKNFLAS